MRAKATTMPPKRRFDRIVAAPSRLIAGVVAAIMLVAGLTVPSAAYAAGNGVLDVALTPVDAAGNILTEAKRGTNGNQVGYRVDFSCAVANCDGTTVRISAPQTNPWGIAVSGSAAPSLLRYQTATPPTSGFSAPPTGDDVTGKTFFLGNLPAGTSGSFTAVYGFGDVTRGTAAGTMYPDGFPLVHSATISSPTATADDSATAPAVRWASAVPAGPAIALRGPVVFKPNTNITYTVSMTDGSNFYESGNFVSNSGLVGAGSTTVTIQLPPEAVVVSAGAGVHDPVARTITWAEGSLDAPTQCAIGGWGLTRESGWNSARPCQTPRTFVVHYPSTAFPAADVNGCNFEAPVTPKATVEAIYLDNARTVKSATSQAAQTVSCYDPFGRADLRKESTHVSNNLPKNIVQVPPDTTGMICPSGGRDDWGNSCTPGQPLAPSAPNELFFWKVDAFNGGNVPGRITVVDDALDQPSLPVVRINTTVTTPLPTIAYTYRCGTAAPVSGTATSANLLLSSLATGTDCRFTKATVTSGTINAGNVRPADTNPGTPFTVNFFFRVDPGAALGQRTNTASASIAYPDYPSVGTVAAPTRTVTTTLIEQPKVASKVGIISKFPVLPIVSGGGQVVPGKEVTFTTGGTTGLFAGDSTFEPQYVFIAPIGWTITPDSAAFGGDVPAGVSFDYHTATIGGQQREVVVASWPAGVSFGINTEMPRMTVVASPTFQVAAGTNSVANAWLGDTRNTVWTSETANFAVRDGATATQDAPDVDADSLTSEWFSNAQTSLRVGAASATTVTKQICSPDADQPDGCTWIGDPGTAVPVSTVADSIAYRIVVRNTGNTTLSGVVAYDVLPYVGDTGTSSGTANIPRGSTFNETLVGVTASSPGVTTSYSASVNPPRPEVYSGATTGNWTAPASGAKALKMTYGSNLAPGQAISFEYTAAVGTGSSADAKACNSVALDTAQTLPSEPPAVCATTAEADLEVTAPATVQAQIGRPAVLPYTVTNKGGSAAATGSVEITVPAGITVTGLTPAGWVCTGPSAVPVTGPATLICVPDAPLAKDVATPLDIPVIVTQDDVVITAEATGPAYDPEEDNNEDAIRIVAAPAPAEGALTVTKDDGVTSTRVGDQLTYSISAKNGLTTEAISNATVSDRIPEGTEFVSASDGGTFAAGEVTWTIATLDADATVTRTVTVQVQDAAASSILNEATATATDPAFPDRTVQGRDTDTDTVERLEFTKTGAVQNSSAPAPGDVVTYTFVLTNRGGGAVSDVTITDPKPGLSPITIASWPSLPGRLGAGESVTGTATYTLTQADVDAGRISNTASASAKTVDGAEVTDAATADVALTAHPALSLDKTGDLASNGAPRPGDVVTYEFTVRNTGNVTITDVAVGDPLPGLSEVTFGAWPGAAGVLGAEQSVTATATYTLTPADLDRGRLDNTATAGGTAVGGDSVESTDTVRVDLPATAALHLEKTGVQDEPGQATAGDTIRYAFTVTNTGNVTLADVAIDDALPGMSAIAYDSWPGAAGVLAAGQSVTATATYVTTQADVDAGHVDNTATATGTSPGGEAAAATDATTVSIPADPALTLEKTGAIGAGVPQAGDTVTFTFLVRNTGSLTVDDVAIADPLDGLSAIEYGAWPGADGVLAPGAEVEAAAEYTLTQADIDLGRVDNIATVTGAAPGDDPVTAADGSTVPLTAAPAIVLTKDAEAPSGRADAGDEVVYSFVVENTGNITVTGVSLADPLPGLSTIGFGDWPGAVGVLAPGEKVTATATYALTQADVDAGRVLNTATATGQGLRGGEVTAEDDAEVTLDAAAGLHLTKSAGPIPEDAMAGDAIEYSFEVENVGNLTVSAVAVGDALPGLSAIGFGDWPAAEGVLAPGETVTATAAYILTQHDLDTGTVFNEATVTGLPARGDAVGSVDDVTIVLPASPALSFEKTGALEDERRPIAGHSATFAFTVTNTGNVTVEAIAITDELDRLGEIEYGDWPAAEGILAPGETVTAGAVYELTQDDVDAGHLDNVATVAGTPARGDGIAEEASVTVPIASVPGLEVVKTAALDDADRDGKANAGERITYSFEVVNTGNVTLTDVVVDDPMVRGIDRITALAPGQTATVAADAYTVTDADAQSGSVKNTATASGLAPDDVRVASDPSSTSTVAGVRPGGLATTGGVDLLPWLPVAGLLVLLGTALALGTRRRRHPRA